MIFQWYNIIYNIIYSAGCTDKIKLHDCKLDFVKKSHFLWYTLYNNIWIIFHSVIILDTYQIP